MSNDEFEFDVSGAMPAAAVPQSKPAKQHESVAANEDAPAKKAVKQQESAAEVSAPQSKVEVSKPNESAVEVKISTPAPKSEPAQQTTAVESEEFYVPNTFDKLEGWIKSGKRFKFWLRLKIVCLLPFLLVLIIFWIIYSASLGAAEEKIDRLMKEKEKTTEQLTQDSVKIDELSSTIEKLNVDIENLQKINDKLKKPAANPKKK